jgi:microcystin-dependent protein
MSIKKGRLRSSGLLATPVQFPAGTVISFAGSTAPEGWMICDGAAISRTDYAGLFAAIGEAWGNGDGTTTFHIPDLRGRFLRGVDGTAERDPDKAGRTASNAGGNIGDAVGSIQNQNTGNHTHSSTAFSDRGWPSGSGDRTSTYYFMHPVRGTNYSLPINGNGGTESRPVNANVQYIIKL